MLIDSSPAAFTLDVPHAAPLDGQSNDLLRIVTTLLSDVWEDELRLAGLLDKFASVPVGLREGFDVGLPREAVDAFFARRGTHFHLYPNHRTALAHPAVINKMIEEETEAGRFSAFYEPEALYAAIGPFRNAPLTIAPKDGGYVGGRVCQDFSHPRDSPEEPSFNSCIDKEAFTCDWGTFVQCYVLAADAPVGTQVAVFDVKAAHRRIPVRRWQQPFYAVMWNGLVALNYCCQFGAASSSGLWGLVADAFRGVFKFRFPSSDALNWADDFTFWRYLNDLGCYDIAEHDIYVFADRLGWPWSPKKTKPFSHRFPYLGFDWDLQQRTVDVNQAKKDKYLATLLQWNRGGAVTKKVAQSLLGKLVHCTMAVPSGRSRLPALSKFAAGFTSTNAFVTHKIPLELCEDLDWWRAMLSSTFCGSAIVRVGPPHPVSVFVDASTSFGISLVVDNSWDYWRLTDGWNTNGREIGWAEMVALEFGVRALVERGFREIHVRIRSDNQGVVGAFDAGKSRSTQCNRVLQRLVTWMMSHGIWVSLKWVASADNLADAPSRGLPVPGLQRHAHNFKLPYQLRDLVELVV